MLFASIWGLSAEIGLFEFNFFGAYEDCAKQKLQFCTGTAARTMANHSGRADVLPRSHHTTIERATCRTYATVHSQGSKRKKDIASSHTRHTPNKLFATYVRTVRQLEFNPTARTVLIPEAKTRTPPSHVPENLSPDYSCRSCTRTLGPHLMIHSGDAILLTLEMQQ